MTRTDMVHSITSFGDRPNEERVVLDYFRGHFQNVFKRAQAMVQAHLPRHFEQNYQPNNGGAGGAGTGGVLGGGVGSVDERALYTHFTAVIDVQQTQDIIRDVKDSIFRSLLNSAAMA
jgi:hypothetical protein